MKKQLLSLIAILALIQTIPAVAREMRAPIPFRNGFQRFEHYPYVCENLDKCWDYDVWGGAFHRQAGDAFTHGTQKETLSGLYFGADSFTGIQIFPAGTVAPNVPALTLDVLTPRFNYSENGAMFGFNINRRFCCGKWDIGMRTNIPFRSVSVVLDDCCSLENAGGDVVVTMVNGVNNPVPENVVNTTGGITPVPDSFAYRLDFLASLPRILNPTPAEIASGDAFFVNFHNAARGGHVTMGADIVDGLDAIDQPPIQLLSSPVGKVPAVPYARRLTASVPGSAPTPVDDLPALSADGVVPAGSDRARFEFPIDYTPLATDVPQQQTLWVVPTATDGAAGFELVDAAKTIRSFVTPFLTQAQITQLIQQTTIDFLRANGVTFDTQRLTGAGDLDVDFYARRNWLCGCRGDFYVEGITGLRLPTGKKVTNPGLLLAQPLGNDGHLEIKFGAQVGIQPCDWFAFKADAQFYHVFSRTEKVAAAFATATIKNIGPTVDAKVSWNYFLGNIDLTFLVPCANSCIGFDLGYQPYYKLKDKVRFDQISAVDFLGNVSVLDAALLESNTKRAAHRIKTEIFHKNCSWEIYGGWLHTMAGKNIQRETDWYLGFGLFF